MFTWLWLMAGPTAVSAATPAGSTPKVCAADPAALALPAWQALGGQAWWLAGATGDTNAANRGGISNLLAVVAPAEPARGEAGEAGEPAASERLWLIGSGPSAVYGQALARSLPCQLGRAPTDVVAPWPRPELVLGQQGLNAARSWAHADVIAAMAERCPRCIERLRLRLGEQAGDLDGTTATRPAHALTGPHGTLGPLRWWRVARGDTVLTLWWHPASGTLTGHGLLWTDGAPDLRDTDIGAMLAALDTLDAIVAQLASPGPGSASAPAQGLRWLPEQGPVTPAEAVGAATLPAQHRRYWQALQQAVEQAQERGTAETDLPATLPGVDPAWLASPRHALNWQRAWRQAEQAWFPTEDKPSQ